MALSVVKTALSVAAITFIVFYLVRWIPGDITDLYAASGDLSAAGQAAMRQELGLDAGGLTPFRQWMVSALQGDLGLSLRFQTSVRSMLVAAIPDTLMLAGGALALGVLLGGTVAILACAFPTRFWRRAVETLNIWSIAVPTFCVGVMAILTFSIRLQWLPIRGQWLMPILILGVDVAGQLAKPLYEELVDVTRKGFVRTARAKGLAAWQVVLRHALPNALTIIVSLAGVIFAGLVGGTLTMEVLFGLNGVGGLTFTAIQGRDYPIIQAGITFLAAIVVVVNLLTTALNVWIDPRLRSTK
jgi:peptide/nickel transport system permease protein